jgi:DNA-binding transcriptional regulator YiaG
MTGKEIRALRNRIGVTQTEFAAIVDPDLKQETLSRWENEQRRPHKFYVALLEQVKRNYERGIYTDEFLMRIQMKLLQEAS